MTTDAYAPGLCEVEIFHFMAGMFEYHPPTLDILITLFALPLWFLSDIYAVYTTDKYYLINVKAVNGKSTCPIDANRQADYQVSHNLHTSIAISCSFGIFCIQYELELCIFIHLPPHAISWCTYISNCVCNVNMLFIDFIYLKKVKTTYVWYRSTMHPWKTLSIENET